VSTKKILFLTDSLSNGGAERQLTLLAKYLPENWDRQIWSLNDGPYAEINRSNGIITNISERKSRFDITPSFNLWDLIKEFKPDIVHSWGWMSAAAAIPLCKFYNIPLIDGTIRSGMVSKKRGKTNKFVMHFADKIIANCYAGLREYRIYPPKGVVIHNGFDPERLSFCNPIAHDNPKICTVVMSGRMSKEKDFIKFIEVARKIYLSEPEGWHFYAIGSGPDKKKLEYFAADLIQSGFFIMLEPGLEVLEFVRKADIGVLLTDTRYHAEGVSNSIMEYMAAGLPVICTDCGGNPELIDNGKSGYLIVDNNSNDLIEKLVFLRDNPEYREYMGLQNRKKILSDFSIDQFIAKTLLLYEEIL
jgi:glycosyltransferase involved in cell wall biosynthesis